MKTDQSIFETLLASSIHDMKNSLGLVMHELETIGAQLENDLEKISSISSLRYEASRINTSLMELLALYKIEKKQLDIHKDETYLIELIEDCLAAHTFLAKSKGIALELDCDDELVWFLDTNLMRIVLNNILSNSIRYSKSKILISAFIIDKQLCLQIDDDGVGYPEAMIEATKHIQYHIDASSGSTGLGLYFSHEIANKHQRQDIKGRINLKNKDKLSGGCFQVFLP